MPRYVEDMSVEAVQGHPLGGVVIRADTELEVALVVRCQVHFHLHGLKVKQINIKVMEFRKKNPLFRLISDQKNGGKN